MYLKFVLEFFLILVNSPKQPSHVKGLSENLKKVPFNGQDYGKQQGPEFSYQSLGCKTWLKNILFS